MGGVGPNVVIAYCWMLHVSFRLLTRKSIMDILYTLNKIGFTVDDNTEAMDILYWYSAYHKEAQKAEEEDRQHANRIKRR